MVTLLQVRKRKLRKVKWLVCALNPVMQLRDSQSLRRGTDNWCRCVPSRRAPTCTSPIPVYIKAALLLEPHTQPRGRFPSASYTSSLLYTCASNSEAPSSGCQCCSERGKGCFSGPSQTARKEVTGRCGRRKASGPGTFQEPHSYPTLHRSSLLRSWGHRTHVCDPPLPRKAPCGNAGGEVMSLGSY